MKSLASEVAELGQAVMVLQGGGALGAYQVGVYEALHEAGIAPQWVIGTSIGAINAALIVGSRPDERLEKLREFWSRVTNDMFVPGGLPAWLATATRNMLAITSGVPSFFSPNPVAFASPHYKVGADSAGYYSVSPLRRTLEDLIDVEQLNNRDTRITVGASCVRTAEMRYFDSRDMPLSIDHIMASGALPPGFPPVRIDGELYWDGGILSNTPVEVVFDDNPRRSGVVFAVHIWNPHGPEPETMWEVMNRQKDVQYSSRAAAHIKRQRQAPARSPEPPPSFEACWLTAAGSSRPAGSGSPAPASPSTPATGSAQSPASSTPRRSRRPGYATSLRSGSWPSTSNC